MKSNFSKFMLLWAGELVSAIGGGLTSFGLGVYIFNQTGSAASMALVTLLGFLPTLLFSIPAGVLADRYDRRLLMIIGDGCSAFGIIYILICMLQGQAALYQICIGVFISSVFSALLEPSYRATITDLLTKEEYSKASGMVSIAGSARYLISPIIAGVLLAISDIKVLLLIDISTFILTVITTAIVKKGIASKKIENTESFKESLKQGWHAITEKQGVFILIIVSSVVTCFMGALQILIEPLILDFSNSVVLGTAETFCACGMLVSSLFLGMKGIKQEYVKILCKSLLLSGICMIGIGVRENIYIICLFGFCFFALLPFINNCLDYLVRVNIPDELQGRAWGMIGFLSQIGYVVAYAVSGMAADKIAIQFEFGVGRGAAGVIVLAGILLSITALFLYSIKSVKMLERRAYD
ncbi:MFS transporter [Intestinibacter sp.]|uniref:MFS transporter n=1 Tax=Intestinibacter sp. TaxID=1965304 RepID=UPI003F13815F